ncbi:MAG TPA: Xaa-Pro peptidase family protein [Rhabdochlamydiaceae bacterium]|nr:Xaa-Pro peptidase family protein [Rhabdochlamydiaceae bacterium]
MKLAGSSTNKQRIKKLQQRLGRIKADAYLIDQPLNLFFLTGLKLSKGELLVGKKSCHLFVDGRYIQAAKEKAPIPASLFSSEAKVKFFKSAKIKTLAFDSENTSYEQFLRLKALKVNLKPDSNPLKELRAIKDEHELNKIRNSARHLWEAYQHIKKLLKPGITEEEVALEFKLFGLKHGAESIGFEPIIAFGANSAFPHYRSGKVKLKKGDLVLMDLGLVVDQYHSDMTRVVFFGPAHPLLKKFYQVVRAAHAAALKLCRPGVLLKDLDIAARKEMKKHDLESYFVHSLGHGVGLEIHEFPRIIKTGEDRDVRLKKGMVVTIEPGLYLPGKGGVRWEDTIIITANGYENLYPEGKS